MCWAGLRRVNRNLGLAARSQTGECWLQQDIAMAMNEFNGKIDLPDETTEKETT